MTQCVKTKASGTEKRNEALVEALWMHVRGHALDAAHNTWTLNLDERLEPWCHLERLRQAISSHGGIAVFGTELALQDRHRTTERLCIKNRKHATP